MAEEDLGLGAKVVEENQTRFVNHDGTFNVHRKGIFKRGAWSPYHAALSISWTRFYLWLFGYYSLVNIIFTGLYISAGTKGFPGVAGLQPTQRISELLFYSIQTLTPLGTSSLVPATLLANGILTLEAIVGILFFTIVASLIFARFSNPATNIIFSRQAVIAPYKEGTAFMFRIINGRSNELINVSAVVSASMRGPDSKLSFHRLILERDGVATFPLNWTVVHPIDDKSPFYGMTDDDFVKQHVEVVVNITAIDENLSKNVYARASYIASEILFGAKFVNILERTEDGTVVVDTERIHELEEVAAIS